MTKSDAEQVEPMKLIFNYNNVFYSFYYDDLGGCIHRSREYAINYVYSGEMILDNGKEQIHVRKGECVFIPRDHHITMYKRTYNGERYCGIFLMFTRRFLREMYSKLGQRRVLALLDIDERFAPTLFDFNEPWKIDILEFMSENYMYEFTMEEMAHYTGRSLATFKRDFKKISDLTPEKWLIRKRLEVAYNKMKEGGKKVVDVYAEVGFKNPSHFSTAFKKQYGISPTAIIA